MAGFYNKMVRPIHFIGDILIINAAYLFSCYFFLNDYHLYFSSQYSKLQLVVNLSWIASILILKTYKLYRVQTLISIINNTLRVLILYYIIIEACDGILTTVHHSGIFVYGFYAITGFFILLWRVAATITLRFLRIKGYNFRRIIVVGVNEATKDMIDFFQSHPHFGYKLYKTFDLGLYNNDFGKLLEDVKIYCLENSIDEIYCSLPEFNFEQISHLIDFTDKEVLRLKFVPHSVGLSLKNFKIDFYGFLPVYLFRTIPLDNTLNKILKRSFDIVFSLLLFVLVFSWLFPLIAIIIKLDSKGPAFFKQRRSGLNNDHFSCYKFRSMYVSDKADGTQATKGDARITKVGAFLRKTSLDELPQFLNVLLGNMSVVGPRPHPLWLNDKYRDNIEKYMVRHFIKPGITGLAQVKGFRGETTDPAMMESRIKMDDFYLENWSFLLDIKIIFSTVFNVLKGDKNAF